MPQFDCPGRGRMDAGLPEGVSSTTSGLFPYLASWLKMKLVQGLLFQRRQLLDVQAMATRQTEEWEKRLADVQTEMQQRIHGAADGVSHRNCINDLRSSRRA